MEAASITMMTSGPYLKYDIFELRLDQVYLFHCLHAIVAAQHTFFGACLSQSEHMVGFELQVCVDW